MKKYLVMVMGVMLLLVGCGNSDTPNTEENTQQMETEISATSETTEITMEIETEVETEVESEPETPTYTYTDMDKTMYAKSSVNVRDLPSTDGEKLGSLSKAQEVHVTGQCNETGWYKIDYNGSTAYVSNSYLVNDKPVEETPEEPSQPSQPTVESFPHALNSPWYDASTGEVYFYTVGTADPLDANYTSAFELLKQYYGDSGLRTVGSKFNEYVGTYAEGDIYLSSAKHMIP